MFKNKNKFNRVFNYILIMFGTISLMSFLIFIKEGYSPNYTFSYNEYVSGIVIYFVYSITSFLMLFLVNNKFNFFDEKYPLSRKLFNSFICIEIINIVLLLSEFITSCLLGNNIQWHYLFFINLGYHYSVVLGSEKYYPKFGYIPAIAVGHIAANNGKYLSNKNSKKINVVNFFVIYLIMSYYINIINSIFQLIFRVDDSIKLLSNIGILLMWVGIVLIAYKIINKNNYVENE